MTRIAKLDIKNVLGIDELEFDAGQYTEIRGRNGSGKTSVLEAIKAALKGGHDATLLRNGEDKGESVLVLDDGRQIAKRIGKDKSQTEVRDADGKKLSRPASIVDQLTDLVSANPVDFLRAPAKYRVQILLESMPIEVDPDYLAQISGIEDIETEGKHAIEAIDTARDAVYRSRQATNRTLKEKQSSIVQLTESLPDSGEQTETTDKDNLLNQLDEAAKRRDAEIERIDNKLDSIVSDAEQQIRELQQKIADTKDKASRQKDRTKQKYNDETSQIRERVAVIDEAERQQAQHQRTREMIAQMREQAESLESESQRCTDAIKQIDEYREKLLGELPIPGLVVSDGQVWRDGVAFDRLNNAQQVEIAVEIAKLRSGELGIICVDGLELLDSERYEEFKKRALDSGLQLFVSRVDDSDFAITTE